jgi:Tfp pilus assembly protein PilV
MSPPAAPAAPRPSRRTGFSTLEALVAVAIVALSLTPLIAIQVQIARTHARNDAARIAAVMQSNALAAIADLNPVAEASGERELAPGATVRWTSKQISTPVRGVGYPLGDGEFEVALFEVSVEARDPARATPLQFSVEKVGWRRAAVGGATPLIQPPGRPGQDDEFIIP